MTWGQAVAMFFGGGVAEAEGDFAAAEARFAESAERMPEGLDRHGLTWVTLRRGYSPCAGAIDRQARAYFARAWRSPATSATRPTSSCTWPAARRWR